MTKIQNLLTLWDNRPRRKINYGMEEDQQFCNSILAALLSAAPTIREDGPLPDPNGNWFLTYTGRKFFPTNPQPEDVCIEDIAHHLARLCRFNGASIPFYSVAQHSVLVARMLPPELQLLGLMHDATEAYCNDLVRPLKYSIPRYMAIEDLIWPAIAAKFNLPLGKPTEIPELKQADNIALMTERRDLLTHTNHKWSLEHVAPLPRKIAPMSPESAESLFLQTFEQLTSLSHDPVIAETPSSASVRSVLETAQNIHTPTVIVSRDGTASLSDQKSDTSDKPATSPAKPAVQPTPKTKRAKPSRRPSKLPAARSLAAVPPESQPTTPTNAQS